MHVLKGKKKKPTFFIPYFTTFPQRTLKWKSANGSILTKAVKIPNMSHSGGHRKHTVIASLF